MARYEIGTYGDRVADYYDRLYPDTAPGMVGRLMELAGEGRVLELGIGTGRVALPMHDLGIEVQGIDASNAMVAELRAKPGGDEIAVAIGDFADVAVGGTVFAGFRRLQHGLRPAEPGRAGALFPQRGAAS